MLIFLLSGREVIATVEESWQELLFWSVLVVIVNFFPVSVEGLRLILDLPILLAVVLLYPPPIAALIGVAASFDSRELNKDFSLSRAMFNRAQIAISTYAAASVFRLVADGITPWTQAVPALAVALVTDYGVNTLLVIVYTRVKSRNDIATIISKLRVGNPATFLTTYLGYGVLALVLAYLFVEVGPWAVTMFLGPILVARQMLVRGQQLEAMASSLRNREHLLENLFDRLVDERRDERLRIASDIHDDVLQSVTSVWMFARLVEKEALARGEVSRDVRDLVRCSEVSIQDLRNIIANLKQSPLGQGGLVPTLRTLTQDLQLDWGIKIRLTIPVEDELQLPADLQVLLYQIARECLLNSLKHASASTIDVSVSCGDVVSLEVRDDGEGFDIGSVDPSRHFGLGLMQERIRMAGGVLEIKSTIGTGTHVTARLPVVTDRR